MVQCTNLVIEPPTLLCRTAKMPRRRSNSKRCICSRLLREQFTFRVTNGGSDETANAGEHWWGRHQYVCIWLPAAPKKLRVSNSKLRK